MNRNDGRVVSNFILSALRSRPISIYGSGSQTRSFQYVHDLVDGLIALMESKYTQPVNIGNPDEYTIQEFAEIIQRLVGTKASLEFKKATEDDPKKRKPDITLAKKELGWKPQFSLNQGLRETVSYFKQIKEDL